MLGNRLVHYSKAWEEKAVTARLNSAPVTRRTFLQGTAGAAGLAALASGLPREVLANPAEWTLVNSMRSVANPYHASFAV